MAGLFDLLIFYNNLKQTNPSRQEIVGNKQIIALMQLLLRSLCMVIILAGSAEATQTHGNPEGLYVHQLSHIFFLFSMGLLIYWIRTRGLTAEIGWRYIQYAAALFMIWTMDAFSTHLLDEHFEWIHVTRAGPWTINIEANHPLTAVAYYLAKMDHLWSVPALLFMFLGLKRLNRDSEKKQVPANHDRGTAP